MTPQLLLILLINNESNKSCILNENFYIKNQSKMKLLPKWITYDSWLTFLCNDKQIAQCKT
jgi:hypothetical protein